MAARHPKRRSGVHMRIVEGETVILDRPGGLIHQLNRTAGYIWDRCDGQSTLVEIGQQLVEAFDVDAKTAADDVAAIVGQLRRLNLLESCERSNYVRLVAQ
jgi:hypothetical protein